MSAEGQSSVHGLREQRTRSSCSTTPVTLTRDTGSRRWCQYVLMDGGMRVRDQDRAV